MDKKEWLILAEKVIKRTRSYRDNRERGIPDSENFQVYYILTKGETPQDAVAYAVYEDKVIFIRSLDDNGKAFEDMKFHFGSELICSNGWKKDISWLKCRWNLIPVSGRSLKAAETIMNHKPAYSCIWIIADITISRKICLQLKPTTTVWIL